MDAVPYPTARALRLSLDNVLKCNARRCASCPISLACLIRIGYVGLTTSFGIDSTVRPARRQLLREGACHNALNKTCRLGILSQNRWTPSWSLAAPREEHPDPTRATTAWPSLERRITAAAIDSLDPHARRRKLFDRWQVDQSTDRGSSSELTIFALGLAPRAISLCDRRWSALMPRSYGWAHSRSTTRTTPPRGSFVFCCDF